MANLSFDDSDPDAPRFGRDFSSAAVLDELPAPVVLHTQDGQVVYGNRRILDLTGYDAEGFVSQTVEELFRDAMPAPGDGVPQADGVGERLPSQTVVHGADGDAIPCLVERRVLDHAGDPLHCVVLRDVAEQRDREDQFRHLVKGVTEYAIFMLDAEGHVKTWNEGAGRIEGYTEEEVLGRHFSIFYPSEDVETGTPTRNLERAARDGQWSGEGWRVRKDGTYFWAFVTLTALYNDDGTVRGFARVTRDMTERHRREIELDRQRQRAEEAKRHAQRENTLLRLMQAVAATAHDAGSLDEALEQTVDIVCEHIGWPVGHVYWARRNGGSYLESSRIWHLDDEERYEAFRVITERLDIPVGGSLPERAMTRRGPVWVRDVSKDPSLIRTSRGGDLGVRGAFAVPLALDDEVVAVLEFYAAEPKPPDEELLTAMESVGTQLSRVAEREEAQSALAASEARYRRLFEDSRDAILLTTPDGAVVDANGAAEALFGYSREELLDLPAAELYADPDERSDKVASVLAEEHGARLLEAEMRHRDGHTFVATASVTVHRNEEGHPELIQALVRDVTERRRLQRELLEVQDEERQRLGQELHDGVCSLLTGAAILTSSLAGEARRGEELDADELDRATEHIQEAADEVRAISHGLSPVGLEGGLLSALESLADRADGRGPEACSFEVTGSVPEVSEDTATHLYRIAQEAINNALKHADAQHIDVTVAGTDEALTLTVRDDGTGLPDSTSGQEGIGMRTMRHRAELIGASLTVETAAEGGTRVQCRVPLPGQS